MFLGWNTNSANSGSTIRCLLENVLWMFKIIWLIWLQALLSILHTLTQFRSIQLCLTFIFLLLLSFPLFSVYILGWNLVWSPHSCAFLIIFRDLNTWQPGYERLCCLRCMQPRDHNFQTTCVCRVPKHLREEKVIECVHCGCRGCASGDWSIFIAQLRYKLWLVIMCVCLQRVCVFNVLLLSTGSIMVWAIADCTFAWEEQKAISIFSHFSVLI